MKSFLIGLGLMYASAAYAETGPRIDVAFVLDATGSMGSYIQQARERIRAIAQDLSAGTPAPVVRFALVRFRDKSDVFLTQKKDFTDDVSLMARWLDETQAKGGGDRPEAVLEGLDVAVQSLSWSMDQQVVRLIYLVGDAPPHQYQYGPTVTSVAQAALSKGIVIHSIACGGIGQRGRHFFDQLARLSEGRTFRLNRQRRREHHRPSRVARTERGLREAISGSARAYSESVGVDFSDTATSTSFAVLKRFDSHAVTGLLGAHIRYVSDQTTWTDLWIAHVSTRTDPDLAAPVIDFNRDAVVITGGHQAGIELVEVKDYSNRRELLVRASADGVHMYRLPRSHKTITVRWFKGEKS